MGSPLSRAGSVRAYDLHDNETQIEEEACIRVGIKTRLTVKKRGKYFVFFFTRTEQRTETETIIIDPFVFGNATYIYARAFEMRIRRENGNK